jgi:DNA-binding MarR family transcriptional regulator
LCYIASNQKCSPAIAIEDLEIGLKTWYAAVARLQELGLVVGVRPLGGKKVRYYTLTREGNEAMTALSSVSLIVESSKARLWAELDGLDVSRNQQRACALLCELLSHAEREADRKAILQLVATAQDAGCTSLALLGGAQLRFLDGRSDEALGIITTALEAEPGPWDSPIGLKLLHLRAQALNNVGTDAIAAKAWHELRKAAKQKGDAELLIEAHIGLGVLAGRGGNLPVAIKELNRALDLATVHKKDSKRAKTLSNLALAEFLEDPDRGLQRASEALSASL